MQNVKRIGVIILFSTLMTAIIMMPNRVNASNTKIIKESVVKYGLGAEFGSSVGKNSRRMYV